MTLFKLHLIKTLYGRMKIQSDVKTSSDIWTPSDHVLGKQKM